MVTRTPTKNGRYWVYPYRSIGGDLMVSMAVFRDGAWEQTSRPQEYAYWRAVNVPRPPKKNFTREYE